jgi:hypothetical protein
VRSAGKAASSATHSERVEQPVGLDRVERLVAGHLEPGLAAVAAARELGLERHRHLRGVAEHLRRGVVAVVDPHDLGAGSQRAVHRRPLVQARAEGDDHVGLLDRALALLRGEAAAHAERARVAGEQPVADQRGREQRADPLAEGLERRARVRQNRAAAGEDDRPLRAGDQVRDRGDVRRDVRPLDGDLRRRTRRTRHRAPLGVRPRQLLVLQVDGQADDDRAPLDERALGGAGQVVGRRARVAQQHRARAHGRRERGDVEGLAHVLAASGLAREHQQRRVLAHGGRQRRERVGQAGTLVDRGDAEPVRDLRVGVGGAHRRRLVAHADEPPAAAVHVVLGELEVAAAEQPEGRSVAEPREGLGYRLEDLHFVVAPSQIMSWTGNVFSITPYFCV